MTITKEQLKETYDYLESLEAPLLASELKVAADTMLSDFKKGVSLANGVGASQSETFFSTIPENILNYHGYDQYGDKL